MKLNESVLLLLKRAKISKNDVTLIMDDAQHITGRIEELYENKVKLRQDSGIAFVPLIEIIKVKSSDDTQESNDWLHRERNGVEFYRSIDGEHEVILLPTSDSGIGEGNMFNELDEKEKKLLTEKRNFRVSKPIGQCSTCLQFKEIIHIFDDKKFCADCSINE